jgi:hypothetical protein
MRLAVGAANGDNGLLFDPFPFDQNGLASPEVDVGGGQVADALMVARSTSVWSPRSSEHALQWDPRKADRHARRATGGNRGHALRSCASESFLVLR